MTILYGAELSYYSGKARAYLRWKDVDFTEVPPSQRIYREEIIPRVGYPVIPCVKMENGDFIQDTTDIIDYFEARLEGPSVYPKGPKQRLVALLLELYGDEWLVIPAMHYRWAYNRDWVVREFGAALKPDVSEAEQRALGDKVSAPFQGFVPLLGVTPETAPEIEDSYEALLGELDAHFARYDYLLGSRPSIGDFGLIGPLYAHLYRDPKSGELMKRLAPHVVEWVKRMQNPPKPLSGDFLPGDEVPETLLPILRRQMREQMPVLAETVERLGEWNDANPDSDIPRSIGMHDFQIGAARGQRMLIPYSQWMLQRAKTHYHQLNIQEKHAADTLLNAINGDKFRDIKFHLQLQRVDTRLTRA